MNPQGLVAAVAGSGIDLTSMLYEVHEWIPFRAGGESGVSHPDACGAPAAPGVAGHACVFLRGCCGLREVIVQQGRFHVYEGFDFARCVRPLDTLYEMGVRTIVFTNAAGGLRPEMEPGQLCASTEVIPWPFRAFALPEALRTEFTVAGCDHRGPYMWMHGPCYETRSEVQALRRAGGATVGMSAATELARCQELGIAAGVVSCITNNCCATRPLSHEHVLKTAAEASVRLAQVLRAFFLHG